MSKAHSIHLFISETTHKKSSLEVSGIRIIFFEIAGKASCL